MILLPMLSIGLKVHISLLTKFIQIYFPLGFKSLKCCLYPGCMGATHESKVALVVSASLQRAAVFLVSPAALGSAIGPGLQLLAVSLLPTSWLKRPYDPQAPLLPQLMGLMCS